MLIEANEEIVYALDNDGKLVCLPDSNDTKVQKGYFVCDDGNVVSEERNLTDAYEKLDDLNEEDWEYKWFGYSVRLLPWAQSYNDLSISSVDIFSQRPS